MPDETGQGKDLKKKVTKFPYDGWWGLEDSFSIYTLKGPVSGFVGHIPLPSLDSIITRNP